MAKKKGTFQLTFPENLKKDTNLSTTSLLAFDDIGDFIEERKKIQRAFEEGLKTTLRVDYSDFANHVFFDSALQKMKIAQDKVLTKYPFNGTSEEKDAFMMTGSDYDNYIFDQWPRSVGYAELNGTTQFISASDVSSNLHLGTSSLYVSAWADPVITDVHPLVQFVSGTTAATDTVGYELAFSGTTDPFVKATLLSGSSVVQVSASYTGYTGSFHNVTLMYDRPGDLLSLYVDGTVQASSSVGPLGPMDTGLNSIVIGSGSTFGFGVASLYSGSVNEVRVLHTASHIYHVKNYSRPIHAAGEFLSGSEREPDYLKAYYTFNEGVTGTGSVDQAVVDYSKSGLHANIVNYDSTARVSGAVMQNDPGDPILYSFHSAVAAFTSSWEISASLYDNNNNNMIYNMIPEQLLIEDDNADGLLQSFSLAMARFFDELKLYIDQFNYLRITNHTSFNETPDAFLPMLQRYFGWKVTEHYGDANPLNFFFGEDVLSSGSLEIPLTEIRNQFWRRILNNLPYLYKTKGKRHNLDSFFNVLGINQANINLKEYGYLPGGSIQDDRIKKEKPVPFLGIGTGSAGVTSGSSVLAPTQFTAWTAGNNFDFCVEAMMQLPFVSASYSGSLLTGSVWHMSGTGFGIHQYLYWVRESLESETGKFVFSGSDSGVGFPVVPISSSDLAVFNGDFVHVTAGRQFAGGGMPFVSVRRVEDGAITLQDHVTGVSNWSFDEDDTFDFHLGAASGTAASEQAIKETQGFYGEYRVWNRELSGSEMDDHALHFESVGINNALEQPHPLEGHWPLNENIVSTDTGAIPGIMDLSRKGIIATGSGFPVSENAYQKFVKEYHHLSPSIDLKWTENKIRVRNKTELTFDEVASDTNEVSLEFNLVDALNEDISKIFSTFDSINELIGSPVNKYRDEYSDLEAASRVYFDRLGDSVNFTNFFKLFRWFDKKLSDSIKQLLPTRVKFIGGEQVVESHFLERSKYGYKYPVFRTPLDPPEAFISASGTLTSKKMTVLEGAIGADAARDTRDVGNKEDTNIPGNFSPSFVRVQSGSTGVVGIPLISTDIDLVMPQVPASGNMMVAAVMFAFCWFYVWYWV